MDAKELRIGNWYLLKSEGISENRVIKTGIDIETIRRRDKDNFVHPVTLTKKWLINFGFNKKDKLTYYNDSISLVYHKHSKTFMFAYFCAGNNYKIIKHVHQLQNLYFSLTGEELQIIVQK